MLPETINDDLTRLESQIRTFGSSSTISEDLRFQSGMEDGGYNERDGNGNGEMTDGSDYNDLVNSSNVCIIGNIKGMLTLTSSSQKLLRISASLGGDIFLCVLCRLMRAAVVCRNSYICLIF